MAMFLRLHGIAAALVALPPQPDMEMGTPSAQMLKLAMATAK
jgi:hypothetical protein